MQEGIIGTEMQQPFLLAQMGRFYPGIILLPSACFYKIQPAFHESQMAVLKQEELLMYLVQTSLVDAIIPCIDTRWTDEELKIRGK